jgi:aminopeptidase N
VRRYQIPTKSITLHHHWFQNNCDLGSAEDAEKTIELCDHHPETALHELAHLWTQDRHTRKWAKRLFLLHEQFLTTSEQEFYYKETIKFYKTAKDLSLSKEVRGKCICGRKV